MLVHQRSKQLGYYQELGLASMTLIKTANVNQQLEKANIKQTNSEFAPLLSKAAFPEGSSCHGNPGTLMAGLQYGDGKENLFDELWLRG